MAPERIALIALGIAFLAALGLGGYRLHALDAALRVAGAELASSTEALSSTKEAYDALVAERDTLEEALAAEQKKNASVATTLRDLSETVGTLDKLARTDPELLAKYSKVYFLNENYVPSALAVIDPAYVFQKDRPLEFHAEAVRRLTALMDDAEEDGIRLSLISAYRSFSTQSSLKASYTVRYGSGANAFSADQGYSEHQLGTAVDFTTAELGADFSDGFDTTEAYAWLTKNAWRYGFILSYPKGNAYYQYEPWHWRFVGTDLAHMLHAEDAQFYDLDQRTIDKYLVSLFD